MYKELLNYETIFSIILIWLVFAKRNPQVFWFYVYILFKLHFGDCLVNGIWEHQEQYFLQDKIYPEMGEANIQSNNNNVVPELPAPLEELGKQRIKQESSDWGGWGVGLTGERHLNKVIKDKQEFAGWREGKGILSKENRQYRHLWVKKIEQCFQRT